MPIKLYKFQPEPTGKMASRLEGLEVNNLYISDPKDFNDPIDMKIEVKDLTTRWVSDESLKNSIKGALAILLSNEGAFSKAKLFDDTLIRAFQTWVEGDMLDDLDGVATALQYRLSDFGVTCLTQDYRNRLLWAHYASMGKGFCIEYEAVPLNNPADLRYIPVQYVSQVPELCVTEAMFSPHQFLYKYAATKHLDWSYEREVRLLSLSAKGREIQVPSDFLRLTGLIGGYQMTPDTLGLLQKTAQRLHVSAFQLGRDVSRETSLVEIFRAE